VVIVGDTGIGMTQDQIRIALQPFGQAAPALISIQRGTGLGLPLVKQMMELHGGRLAVISEIGSGTVIEMYFPAIDPSPVHS
jgi:two-component system cell cycle sensor histidine kinase PleC